jgi:hypothetical protein
MSFHRIFADNTNPRSVASRLRRKRYRIFQRLIEDLPRPVTVLDVGGTPTYWSMVPAEAKEGLQITLLNVEQMPPPGDGLRSVAGDARDLSQFGDRSFDVVFSNSVIEHVGNHGDQRSMAREVRRVGRRYHVQTPNRYFPIEPHFQFPMFQFLPTSVRAQLASRYALGWYSRLDNIEEAYDLVSSIRLLSRRELRGLFPEASIVTERFAGLAKSFVAVSRGG